MLSARTTRSNDQASEATRSIVIALCEVDATIALTAPVLRQAIFYIWEGGEAAKWRLDQPYSSAAKAIRNRGIDRRVLRYDHAIPLATVRHRLIEARQSATAFKVTLKKYVRSAILTKEEDDLLSRAYRSTMPQDARPDDAMARYRAVGIKFDLDDELLLTRE